MISGLPGTSLHVKSTVRSYAKKQGSVVAFLGNQYRYQAIGSSRHLLRLFGSHSTTQRHSRMGSDFNFVIDTKDPSTNALRLLSGCGNKFLKRVMVVHCIVQLIFSEMAPSARNPTLLLDAFALKNISDVVKQFLGLMYFC